MIIQQSKDEAVNLVDSMASLADDKRRMLRGYVGRAAMGDEVALTHVILFPYRQEDYGVISRIINLIFHARYATHGSA